MFLYKKTRFLVGIVLDYFKNRKKLNRFEKLNKHLFLKSVTRYNLIKKESKYPILNNLKHLIQFVYLKSINHLQTIQIMLFK